MCNKLIQVQVLHILTLPSLLLDSGYSISHDGACATNPFVFTTRLVMPRGPNLADDLFYRSLQVLPVENNK
jgi:hypothetical protein